MSDLIEGFVVGGSTAVTVSNVGVGVVLTVKPRHVEQVEIVMSADQSRRLRKLLNAAEKRGSQ